MSTNVTSMRARNPDETKELLLNAALQEIQLHGFQAASIDRILKDTGLTKGALYHHFKNKKELGYAVVEQHIRQEITEKWVLPLEECSDPLDTMMQLIIHAREELDSKFANGCPMVNIGQEMANLDEGFRHRIDDIYDLWIDAIAKALLKGQLNNKVSRNIAPDQIACFFVASAEGTLVLSKVKKSPATMKNCAFAMMQYLDSLRP